MKLYRFTFLKREVTKGDKEITVNLGFVDVVESKLPDGSSMYAKAFRMATQEQRNANAVEVQEL